MGKPTKSGGYLMDMKGLSVECRILAYVYLLTHNFGIQQEVSRGASEPKDLKCFEIAQFN